MDANGTHGKNRVILVRLRSLGDTVLMTPMLSVIKRLADWEIGVVVEKAYARVLEGNAEVDRLFVVSDRPTQWIARWQLLQDIRAFHPTMTIDLHGGTTSAFLTALSGAPHRAGYEDSRGARFYNVRIPDSRTIWKRDQVHTVEHQLAMLKFLGFPVEPIPPLRLDVNEADLEWARARVGQEAAGGGFILIHPAAAFDTKQWEVEKFASLAELLVKRGRRVIITAGPDDKGLLEVLEQTCSSDVRIISPLDLGRFSALVSLCDLYIGNDTGSTHIAAALGKKIVVIFGSSDFKVWHPWRTDHRLIRSDLPCIPCPGYYCLHFDEPKCIRSIDVDPVFESAISLL